MRSSSATGSPAFAASPAQGFEHQPVVTGGGHRSMELPELQWLNTVLGNIKNARQDTHHEASGKHLLRYLGELCYRFNRRFDLAAMLPRFGRAAVRTPRLPSPLMVLPEPCQ